MQSPWVYERSLQKDEHGNPSVQTVISKSQGIRLDHNNYGYVGRKWYSQFTFRLGTKPDWARNSHELVFLDNDDLESGNKLVESLHKIKDVHPFVLTAMSHMYDRVSAHGPVDDLLQDNLRLWINAIKAEWPPVTKKKLPGGLQFKQEWTHFGRVVIVGDPGSLHFDRVAVVQDFRTNQETLHYKTRDVYLQLNVAVDKNGLKKISPVFTKFILFMKAMSLAVSEGDLRDKLEEWIRQAEARYADGAVTPQRSLYEKELAYYIANAKYMQPGVLLDRLREKLSRLRREAEESEDRRDLPAPLTARSSGAGFLPRCAVHSKNHHGVEHIANHPHLALHARCTCITDI